MEQVYDIVQEESGRVHEDSADTSESLQDFKTLREAAKNTLVSSLTYMFSRLWNEEIRVGVIPPPLDYADSAAYGSHHQQRSRHKTSTFTTAFMDTVRLKTDYS